MNGKSTFSAPATGRQQAWALPHLTHTHEAEGRIDCQGEVPPHLASHAIRECPEISLPIEQKNKMARGDTWYSRVKNRLCADGLGSVSWPPHSALGLHPELLSCRLRLNPGLKKKKERKEKKRRLGIFFAPLIDAEIGSASLTSISILCGLELENRENQTFSRMSKAHSVLFWGFRGSCGMWSINDLPEKTQKSTFSRGGYFFCFECHRTRHTTLRIIKTLHHAGKIHERSCKLFQLWFAVHHSKPCEKRRELRGEESWKPLVFLQSVNRPLDSQDQTSESGSGGGLCARSG